MSMRPLGFVLSVAILAAAALSRGSAAAGDSLLPPEGFVGIAEPASGNAAIAETDPGVAGEDEVQGPARSTTGGPVKAAARTGEGPAAATAAPDADAEARPASRLLRSLEEWAGPATGASPSPTPDPVSAGGGQTAAGAPIGGVPGSSPVTGRSPVFHGCPRALLGALLASAADADDAVAALAIERETLALCRERQEIVNGIVALEGELGTLLAEVRAKAAAGPVVEAVSSTVADNPTVRASAPVRVVSLPPAASALGEAPKEAEAPAIPAPPSYFWFSIIGTAGDLRAGIGDGESGGTSVWFVREGDRLPGEVVITGIGTKPPGVRIGGTEEASLPYRPRSADASLAASGIVRLGGDAEGDGR